MGQKINPIALRAKVLGYKRGGWCVPATHGASSDYATKLKVDHLIRQSAKPLVKALDLIEVQVQFTEHNIILVNLYLPYPDYLYVNLTEQFQVLVEQTCHTHSAENLKEALINVLEWPDTLVKILRKHKSPLSDHHINARIKLVKSPYHNPKFIAKAIQASLQRRVSIRRAIKMWANIAMSHQIGDLRIKGIRVRLSGRLNGAEMARSEQLSIGKVSLHTITSPVNYYCHHYNTPCGIFGIKVWISSY